MKKFKATGVRLGFTLMNIANLGVGICIAFAFSWPITLLIIAFIPLLIIGGIFQTKALAGFAEENKKVLEQAGSVNFLILFKFKKLVDPDI
jgi:hypothetical protein